MCSSMTYALVWICLGSIDYLVLLYIQCSCLYTFVAFLFNVGGNLEGSLSPFRDEVSRTGSDRPDRLVTLIFSPHRFLLVVRNRRSEPIVLIKEVRLELWTRIRLWDGGRDEVSRLHILWYPGQIRPHPPPYVFNINELWIPLLLTLTPAIGGLGQPISNSRAFAPLPHHGRV